MTNKKGEIFRLNQSMFGKKMIKKNIDKIFSYPRDPHMLPNFVFFPASVNKGTKCLMPRKTPVKLIDINF